MMKIHEIAPDL